jgi:Ca2+-binding EF-hand superfamily protein
MDIKTSDELLKKSLFNDFTFLPMVNFYFNSADIDGSGYIEKAEINKFLTKFSKEQKLDPPTEKDIEETLNELDKNKDGKLCKKEFQDLVKQIVKEMVGFK